MILTYTYRTQTLENCTRYTCPHIMFTWILTIDLGHVLAGQVVGVVRGARIDGRIAHGEELVHPGNWSTQNQNKKALKMAPIDEVHTFFTLTSLRPLDR